MQSGGPSYAVELGRLDGLVSKASDVNGNLPQPTFNLNQLNSMFGSHGLNQADMIALSGTLFSLLYMLYSLICFNMFRLLTEELLTFKSTFRRS